MTHLAAGTEATDAVNLAQLKAVADVADATARQFKAACPAAQATACCSASRWRTARACST
ncbi:hypothetical protein ACKVMH_07010 [Lysobacter zhanggongensis]|uniref:hypothetical protein n=1 Tax=Lysobacter zhanggongensis TaxID=1774951 RepID=UPI00399C6F98